MSTEQEPGAVRRWIDQQIRQARTYTFNEMQDWADTHDAEDAQLRESRDFKDKELADDAIRISKLYATLSEREALLARLVSVVKAARGTHGEMCSDWGNCQFVREADAALAAARAVAPADPWGCPECRMGFHQHTETCSRRAVAP